MTVITRMLRPWLHSREYVTSIQGALDAQDGASIRRVVLTGTYDVTSSLTVPNNCEIEGDARNGALVRVPAGSTFPIFDISAKTGVVIRNLQGGKVAGAALSTRGYLVWIHGASGDVLVENVLGDGFVSTVQVGYGPTSTTDGTTDRVTLRNVTALNSPTLYGITLDNVNTVVVDNCYGRGNWLDGLKLRKKTKYVTILGGEFSGNGVSGAGDGADFYSGGDTVSVHGTTFRANAGSGLTVKQSNGLTAAVYGYVRNVQIIGARFIGNLAGAGLYMPAASDTSVPQNASIMVSGCLSEGNLGATTGDGFYNGARNASFVGCTARRNDRHGFTDSTRAIDALYIASHAVANSQNAAGSYHGWSLSGNGGTLMGCRAIGADSDDMSQESDYAALTKYHDQGILIKSDSTGSWRVDNCTSTYHNATGSGIRTDRTSGSVVIHQDRAGDPTSVGAYGSLGSEVINTSATIAADVQFVKTSGNPNQATTGWTRTSAVLVGSKTFDWPNILAAAQSTTTVTVTGAALGDIATASMSVDLQAMQITAHVSAADTVTVVMKNDTAGAINLASATLAARVMKAV